MDYREKILRLAGISPLLPTTVAKELQTTTLIASAFLSELVSKGLLAVTNLKIGSSPLYYLPSAKHQLLNYIKYLNEKDQKTVKLLSEKKVLQNNSLDPLTRVSLTQLKDFAQLVEVNLNGRKELFWKWFLTSDEEAKSLIQALLEPARQIQQEQANKQAGPENTGQEQKEQLKEKREEKKRRKCAEDFLQKIQAWFTKNQIKIIETTTVKKNTEYDFLIEIDSSIGRLTYHCTATAKKQVNETDLSSAFVRAQLKKLPAVILVEGRLSSRAGKILENLKGLVVKKL